MVQQVLIAILAVNFMASLIFLIKNRKGKKETALMFLLFLTAPVAGFLLYYIPVWMFHALHNRNVYNIEDLIYEGESADHIKRPDIEKEMNVIPVKEALVVNDAAQKRKFILDIIKTDMNENYKTILPALKDSDSETSHYAAAMAMEIQSRLRKKIQELEREYAAGETKPEPLLEAYKEYADSGILTGKDIADIKKRYIRLMEKADGGELDNRFYVTLAGYLAEEKREDEAAAVLKKRLGEKPEEPLYDKLLELYYQTGKEEEFRQTIKEVRSSRIVLSPEGLEKLRFWIGKGE